MEGGPVALGARPATALVSVGPREELSLSLTLAASIRRSEVMGGRPPWPSASLPSLLSVGPSGKLSSHLQAV